VGALYYWPGIIIGYVYVLAESGENVVNEVPLEFLDNDEGSLAKGAKR
jgi:hypothetical protein